MLRPIYIAPVLNGFTVSVGCQTLAYTSIDKLILDLGAYLRDPEATEKRLLKEEGFNRRHTLDVSPVPRADRMTAGFDLASRPADCTAQTPVGINVHRGAENCPD